MNLFDDKGVAFDPTKAALGGDLNPKYTADDQKTVEKVVTLFDYGRRRLADFFNRQLLCLEFLQDRQWSDDELKVFSKDRRAPLTLNVMGTIVGGVEGLMRLGKSDMAVKPGGVGLDIKMADTAKKLLDAWSYDNQLDDLNSLIFYGGLTALDSWHVYVDDEPGSGGYYKRVCVERPEFGSVIYDPDFTDPRLKDMRWQIRLKYYRQDELAERWPEKMARLRFDSAEYDEWWREIQSGNSFGNFKDSFQQPLVDRQNGLYATLELYEKRKQSRVAIMDASLTQQGELPPGKYNAAMVQRSLPPGLWAIDVEYKVMQRTTILPYQWQVLDGETEEYETWPYTPFASKHKGCKLSQASSYVFSLIGPQRARNIDATNQREFVTRTIRGGWMTYNDEDKEELKRHGSEINAVLKIKDPLFKPEQITPPNISTGIAELQKSGDRDLELISGLSLQQSYGGSQPGEPGVVRKQRREESQTTLYPYLEDFYNKVAIVASGMLERGCKVLQPGQMLRITGDDGNEQFMQASEQLVSQFKNAKFDIRVMDGPFATTQKREKYEDGLNLLTVSTQVDPMVGKALLPETIKNSPIDNASELGILAESIVAPQIAAGMVQVTNPPQVTGGLPGENPAPPKQ